MCFLEIKNIHCVLWNILGTKKFSNLLEHKIKYNNYYIVHRNLKLKKIQRIPLKIQIIVYRNKLKLHVNIRESQ